MEVKTDRQTTTRLKGVLGSKSETRKPMQQITVLARNGEARLPEWVTSSGPHSCPQNLTDLVKALRVRAS